MHVYLHSYLYLISVSELVSIYCYFTTPTTTSKSTTAAMSITTAVTILLDQLRHRKSQQSPLPKGREVLPRRTRSALRRMHWHKQAEQHLAMAVHEAPSRDKEALVAG